MNNRKNEKGTAAMVRQQIRKGGLTCQTSGLAPGHAQANLCILPSELAFDFLLFCQRNPKSCPLLHVLEAGCYKVPGQDIDVRTDLPGYRIYRDGKLQEEVSDILGLWQDNFVTFVVGCSFSFEDALQNVGIPIRHIEMGVNVPMFNTNIPCESAGRFSGEMVVSMRPMSPAQAIAATQITARFPRVHGSPVHFGNAKSIGIGNLQKPDYGDAVPINEGEIPVFWACGVTPQAVVMHSKPPLCITHAPGKMLILDTTNESLAM